MADKLLIVLMNSDPHNGQELAMPFLQASVAAAMEYQVEILLTGRAGELANKGIAETVLLSETSKKTVYDLMREAVNAGVKIKICASNYESWREDLIPEINETVGTAYVISEAMDDETVTFTY